MLASNTNESSHSPPFPQASMAPLKLQPKSGIVPRVCQRWMHCIAENSTPQEEKTYWNRSEAREAMAVNMVQQPLSTKPPATRCSTRYIRCHYHDDNPKNENSCGAVAALLVSRIPMYTHHCTPQQPRKRMCLYSGSMGLQREEHKQKAAPCMANSLLSFTRQFDGATVRVPSTPHHLRTHYGYPIRERARAARHTVGIR